MKGRIFWFWFATGVVLALLKADFLLGRVRFLDAALEILSTPGVVISLPLHNFVASPWWVGALICVMNGLFYGFAARMIVRRGRKARRRK